MNNDLTIGRVAGIPIGISWSWVVVLAVMLWTLGGAIFPAQNPGLGAGTYAAMAVVAATMFFASLLLHELAHALTAERLGMTIEGITLWLFGGVARFSGVFPGARAELRIAIAGPLMSVGLGALFVTVAAITHLGRAVDGVLAWLGYINLVLAAFNLLPAQPLDGGRVLHAILWRRSGELVTATRTAARVGEAFGLAMIVVGAAGVVGFGALGGVWIAVLGWFLMTAARREAQAIVVRSSLGDVTVAELMSRRPVYVDPEMSISAFLDGVAGDTRFTTYPVVTSSGAVRGLLSFKDAAAVNRTERDRVRVGSRMRPRTAIPVVAPEDAVAEVLDRMAASDQNRALVLDDEKLVGILSVTDVIRALGLGRADLPAGRGRAGRPNNA